MIYATTIGRELNSQRVIQQQQKKKVLIFFPFFNPNRKRNISFLYFFSCPREHSRESRNNNNIIQKNTRE